jgi:SSS family solute:Na+ symporter
VTLVSGFVLGIFAFVVSLSGDESMTALHPLHDGLISLLGGGKLAETIVNLHWMVASFWLCVIGIAIHVVVSLWTPEELTAEKAQLVWPHPLDALKSPGWTGIGNYKVLAALLLVFLVGIYAILG